MFDVSFTELMVIGVIALIVIGPERLPKVARTVGHLLGRAQRYVNDVKGDIQREIELDELRKFKSEMSDAANSVKTSLRDTENSLRTGLDDTAREATEGLADLKKKVETTGDTPSGVAAQAAPAPEAPAAVDATPAATEAPVPAPSSAPTSSPPTAEPPVTAPTPMPADPTAVASTEPAAAPKPNTPTAP